MSSAGGTTSGREMARATSVYATINAARERIQRRERRANRLSVDPAHHFLVAHDLPWIAFIDDLAAVDRVQAVRDPRSTAADQLPPSHRDFTLLALLDTVDQPRPPYHRATLEQPRCQVAADR